MVSALLILFWMMNDSIGPAADQTSVRKEAGDHESMILKASNKPVAPTRAFFQQHCIKCHGPDKQQGKVRLDDLPMAINHQATAERWDDVLWVLETNEMPPKDEPAVDKQVRQQTIGWIEQLLEAGLSEHARYPHTPIRRMTRLQYNNAVADLLELRVDLFALPERMMRSHSNYFKPEAGVMPDTVKVGSRPLGKSQLVQNRLQGVAPFPQDLRAEHGFDNRGDHLSLSPLLMEEFLKLSQSIMNSRDFGPKTSGAWQWFFKPPKDAKTIDDEVPKRLRTFLTRAFRRTVDDATHKRYTDYTLGRIEAGDSFTDAMKQAASAVLASPRFLYLYDESVTARSQPVDDLELASRLSFFLWGSIPDQQLLDLAEANRLSEPAELDKQIDRMLNDPKMKRFCDAFPAQWLQLERIVSSRPTGEAARGFTINGRYRASMHMMAEPLLLFEAVLIEDRSILELIDPPFSYRSALLQNWMNGGKTNAGPPTVMTFKRVPNIDRREGGVITNPAVLTMTSGADHTKPITRGAWVATVIFNAPPDPPPGDVPALPEGKDAGNENLTLRERLDLHSTRQDCKGCHAKIDPYGFALEHYDQAGRWRDKYKNGREIDSAGELFRTHAFADPVQFKDAILSEKDRFTRAFAEHMLSYALGRESGVADSPALDAIAQAVADDGYKMRTMIRSIATSEPFLAKGNPEEPLNQAD
ncbi:MAG: DUF1592 domain-containing protein [Planctomycetota bacterium]